MDIWYIAFLIVALILGVVIGGFGMFYIIKNNPKYLTQSLAQDREDAKAALAKIEGNIKVFSGPIIPQKSSAPQVVESKITPVIEPAPPAEKKDATRVIADIKKIL